METMSSLKFSDADHVAFFMTASEEFLRVANTVLGPQFMELEDWPGLIGFAERNFPEPLESGCPSVAEYLKVGHSFLAYEPLTVAKLYLLFLTMGTGNLMLRLCSSPDIFNALRLKSPLDADRLNKISHLKNIFERWKTLTVTNSQLNKLPHLELAEV